MEQYRYFRYSLKESVSSVFHVSVFHYDLCASIGSVILQHAIVASSHINKAKLTRIPTKNGQEKHGHKTLTLSLNNWDSL